MQVAFTGKCYHNGNLIARGTVYTYAREMGWVPSEEVVGSSLLVCDLTSTGGRVTGKLATARNVGVPTTDYNTFMRLVGELQRWPTSRRPLVTRDTHYNTFVARSAGEVIGSAADLAALRLHLERTRNNLVQQATEELAQESAQAAERAQEEAWRQQFPARGPGSGLHIARISGAWQVRDGSSIRATHPDLPGAQAWLSEARRSREAAVERLQERNRREMAQGLNDAADLAARPPGRTQAEAQTPAQPELVLRTVAELRAILGDLPARIEVAYMKAEPFGLTIHMGCVGNNHVLEARRGAEVVFHANEPMADGAVAPTWALLAAFLDNYQPPRTAMPTRKRNLDMDI